MTIDMNIDQVLLGKASPFGERGGLSGIDKKSIAGRAAFNELGFLEDEQGDLSVHGGVDKAIHHYPFDYYEKWRSLFEADGSPAGQLLKTPGAFGENISLTGLTDREVCIGDIFQLGSGVVQISQGRTPCWKLNERFQNQEMVKRVMETGMTGWYYRVLAPGDVGAGDTFRLKERLAPSWPLTKVTGVIFNKKSDLKLVEDIALLPFLSESWRQQLLKRLAK